MSRLLNTMSRHRETVTRQRFDAGSIDDDTGRYTKDPTPTESSITDARVYPASREQVERLPEGMRTRETLAIHTASELRAAVTGDSGTPPDRIVRGGVTYEVGSVAYWHHGRYEAVLARVEA